MSQIRPLIIGLITLFCLDTQASVLNYNLDFKHAISAKRGPQLHARRGGIQSIAVIPDATASGNTSMEMPDAIKPYQGLLENIATLEADMKAKHSQALTLPSDDLLGATLACAEVVNSADEVMGQLETAVPNEKKRDQIVGELSELLEKTCGDDLFALAEYLIPGQEMALTEKIVARFEKSNNEEIQHLAENVATHVMTVAFERISEPKKQKFAAVYPTVVGNSQFMSALYSNIRSSVGMNVCDYRLPLFARLSRKIWIENLAQAVDFFKGDVEVTIRELTAKPWQFRDLDFADLKNLQDGDLKKQLRVAFALEDGKKAVAFRAFSDIVNSAQQFLDLSPRSIARIQASIEASIRMIKTQLSTSRQQLEDFKSGKLKDPKIDPNALALLIPGVEANLAEQER